MSSYPSFLPPAKARGSRVLVIACRKSPLKEAHGQDNLSTKGKLAGPKGGLY